MRAFADLIAKRATLRWLTECHPQWTHQELAAALGMSRFLREQVVPPIAPSRPQDVMVLHSRSRARQTPPASIASQLAIVQRILEIRSAPPENLHRVPGPEAILYSLHRDPTLKNAGLRLPHSQTPIGKIVRQAGCIALDSRQKPKPLEPRQPGEEVQFDLKDGSQVPADPEGKRQHVVEVANFIDAGTSIWLHREVRSACRCIGQARSRRSSPLTEAYLTHYNSERPNQARSCGNHPPRVACPTFPTLPAVPQTVDPDRWLMQINQQAFARTIRANGKLTINREDYYVSRSLAGKPGRMLGERRPEAV